MIAAACHWTNGGGGAIVVTALRRAIAGRSDVLKLK